MHPIWLEKDLILDQVEPVDEVKEGEEAEAPDIWENIVGCIDNTKKD